MTDGDTHFRNDTVRLLTRGLRIPHHFTLPYTPWSNGAVERLGKKISRIFRATLSDYRMAESEWPSLVPLPQHALSSSPSARRKDFAPITISTGLKPTGPLLTMKIPSSRTIISIKEAELQINLETNKLQIFLDEIHPLVKIHIEKEREKERLHHSKGKLPNFDVGDYVLVSRPTTGPNEKLSLRWTGPRQVTKLAGPYIATVLDLRNNLETNVNITKLCYYSDSQLNQESIMSHILYSEEIMPVQRLMELQDTATAIMVRVRWKGLSAEKDTLEALANIYEDVPKMLESLLRRKSTPTDIAARTWNALRLEKGGV